MCRCILVQPYLLIHHYQHHQQEYIDKDSIPVLLIMGRVILAFWILGQRRIVQMIRDIAFLPAEADMVTRRSLLFLAALTPLPYLDRVLPTGYASWGVIQ